MRLECPIEGFEHCFVELSDRWTRKEANDFRTAEIDQSAQILKAKVTAIQLDCADGQHITHADMLVDERLDQLDVQVYNWLPGALMVGLRDLENLGFRAGLRRSDTTAGNSAPATDSPPA